MILGFSTSGPYCGVALFDQGDVTTVLHEELPKGQAERLMPMMGEVLQSAGATFGDLKGIGVGIGPGNFTGIRIGVSAARGLALGLGIPAVGVSGLQALALGHDGPVLACINAGRDRFYLQRFGTEILRGPEVVDAADLTSWAHPGLTCIGDKAIEIAAVLGATGSPASFYPAAAIARIAATRYQSETKRPAPLYLRAADAAPARDPAPTIL